MTTQTARLPREIDASEMPFERSGGVWVLPILVLAAWALAIRHLAPEWNFSEQYEYGWLVPLLTLYLLKVRAERCPLPGTSPRLWSFVGVLILLVGLSMVVMPLREANADWRMLGWVLTSLAGTISLLAVWQIGGLPWVRHFGIPILFFFTAVPISRELEASAMQWLMRHNAHVAVELLHWLGVSAEARGNLIALPSGTLGIDEACSGVRSLLGTLMLSLFLGEMVALSRARRVLLLLLGVLLALSTNVVRTSTLALIATAKGLPAMEHWHDVAGYAVLGICWAAIVLSAWLLRPRAEKIHASRSGTPITIDQIFPRLQHAAWPSAVGIALLLTGLALTEYWFRRQERSVTSLAGWTFGMPANERDFRPVEIPARVREDLRFDYGNSAPVARRPRLALAGALFPMAARPQRRSKPSPCTILKSASPPSA